MLKRMLSLLCYCMLVQISIAQDCTGYFPFEEDTTYEMTTYDKKGKKTAVVESTIALVEPDGDNFRAVIQTQIRDEDNEDLMSNKYDVSCKGGTFYIDATAFMNPASLSAYDGMDVEVTGQGIELPATLSVGQELADANTEVQVSSNDIKIMKMTFSQENRKVEGQEKITTPAGTYDCYVITYDTTMKMLMKKTSQVKEWYAKGVGMVRQETYGKKGKLEGYTELTKFEVGQ